MNSGITIGDVNGDGQVDVVAATNSGQIWVLNGATGDPISNFPLKAGGPVLAPVTLAKLHDNGHPSLELVCASSLVFCLFCGAYFGFLNLAEL